MSEITGLRLKNGREKLVRVFLDGKLAFSLGAESAVKDGLRVGQELGEDRVQALLEAEQSRRCYVSAVRYLGYRARSEAELRDKLKRRGFDDESIQAALDKLKKQGLVNDAEFVRFWTEDRESFSPRSRRLTSLELRRKGIDKEIIDRAVEAVDDSDSAYRAASARAPRLPHTDRQVFRRRMGDYLRRRGFSYDIIEQTVNRLWQEMETGQRDET